MPEDNEARTFHFTDATGDHMVEVWCEGRDYDPVGEAYHPMYSYKIVTPEWEYINNDIRGNNNSVPDNLLAAQSLFAFLYACQQGMPKVGQFDKGENADLFPPHVREWAYHFAEQLELVYGELVQEGKRKQK